MLNRFDSDANYLTHDIIHVYGSQIDNVQEELMSQLRNPLFCDIEVRTFSISVDGDTYGLIVDVEKECVHLQPHSQI